MTDRDRLAADLHPWTCRNWETDHEPGQPAKHSLDFVACIPAADRLIALGWMRLDGDLTILRAYKKGFQRGRVTLDEERLARALLEPYDEGQADPEWGIPGRCRACGEDGVWSKDVRRDVPAIAKAYREDTDATD